MHEHVIVAMEAGKPAKVECRECHKQHLFRAGPPPTTATSPPTRRPRAPSATPEIARVTRARPRVIARVTLHAADHGCAGGGPCVIARCEYVGWMPGVSQCGVSSDEGKCWTNAGA